MRIQIDIAHPAHIHYFRNFAAIFKSKGHQVLFTLRDKGIIHYLAGKYELDYKIRSRNSSTKIAYAMSSIRAIWEIAREFKPDLFLDMGTVFASPVAKFLRKPYLAFDDTETSFRTRALHMPFTDIILTPDAFEIDLGKKQIRFNGFMELMYLHKNYYHPDTSVLKMLGVASNEKYAILRFVSWEAHHDKGLLGFSLENKIKVVKTLSKYAKVFISSEKKLPHDLQSFSLNIPPEKIHDALAFSALFLGEGATMATESNLLGTPAIYLNEHWLGCTNLLRSSGMLFSYKENQYAQNMAIAKGVELLKSDNKTEWLKRRDKILADKIDVTAFLVWFVENYPDSAQTMRKDPNYQWRFK